MWRARIGPCRLLHILCWPASLRILLRDLCFIPHKSRSCPATAAIVPGRLTAAVPCAARSRLATADLKRLTSARSPLGNPAGVTFGQRVSADRYSVPLFEVRRAHSALGQNRRSIGATSSTTRPSRTSPVPNHLYSIVFCHGGGPPWQPRPSWRWKAPMRGEGCATLLTSSGSACWLGAGNPLAVTAGLDLASSIAYSKAIETSIVVARESSVNVGGSDSAFPHIKKLNGKESPANGDRHARTHARARH